MLPSDCLPNRRHFLKAGIGLAAVSTALTSFAVAPVANAADDNWIIGPRPGYTPQVGTLVSMLELTRKQVEHNTKGMTTADLDFLLDSKANTIGAMLYHLAAVDHYYALNSFGGMKWDSWPADEKKKWDAPANLGDAGRKTIKGNSLDFYITQLHETREHTLSELKKRDDKWLTVVDTEMGMNNYAKWFHVAEHESNHDGQIKFLKSRLPGAKPSAE